MTSFQSFPLVANGNLVLQSPSKKAYSDFDTDFASYFCASIIQNHVDEEMCGLHSSLFKVPTSALPTSRLWQDLPGRDSKTSYADSDLSFASLEPNVGG